jgi:hypothetical protein
VTDADAGIFRAASQGAESQWKWLDTLTEQAGYDDARTSVILLLMATCAIVGGAAAWRHTGGIVPGILSGLIAGSLPYFYLLRKRHQRFQQFEQQFPDALDMMTRSLRAGHALSGAIGLVGDADPVGQNWDGCSKRSARLDPGGHWPISGASPQRTPDYTSASSGSAAATSPRSDRWPKSPSASLLRQARASTEHWDASAWVEPIRLALISS